MGTGYYIEITGSERDGYTVSTYGLTGGAQHERFIDGYNARKYATARGRVLGLHVHERYGAEPSGS